MADRKSDVTRNAKEDEFITFGEAIRKAARARPIQVKRLAQHLWPSLRPTVIVAAIVAVLAFVAWAIPEVFGAQDRERLPGPPVYPSWFTVQPAMGQNGEPIRYVVKTEYSAVVMQPSGDVEVKTIGSIEVDLLKGTNGVFIGTQFYPDRLVARLLDIIAMREYKMAHPKTLEDDERTRILRP